MVLSLSRRKNVMGGKGQFTHSVFFTKWWHQRNNRLSPLVTLSWNTVQQWVANTPKASYKLVLVRLCPMHSAAWKQRQEESRGGEDQNFHHKLCDRGEMHCSWSCFSHCFLFKIFCPGASKNCLTLALSIFIGQKKKNPRNPQRVFPSSNCSQIVFYKPSRFSFYTRRAELPFSPSALSSKSSPLSLVQGIGLSKSIASVKTTHLV